jgi:hypothetical protein
MRGLGAWQPTIIYPATGIAGLWQAPAAPPGALARLPGHFVGEDHHLDPVAQSELGQHAGDVAFHRGATRTLIGLRRMPVDIAVGSVGSFR